MTHEPEQHSIALRIQRMSVGEQVVALARVAETRSADRTFRPSDVEQLYAEIAVPAPRVRDVTGRLERSGHVVRDRAGGKLKLTPEGRLRSTQTLSDMDATVLAAELARAGAPQLGQARQAIVPPQLAPPELVAPLRAFLERYPFETNVFGMTRFPDESDAEEDPDPVNEALEVARDACAAHGFAFHLASDRAIHDQLWTNVAGHMWASSYGLAFFEDRRGRGLNYNLTIEVGAMIMAGRSCALLKDTSIPSMPTDLVGHIFRPVDLDDLTTVRDAIHDWLRERDTPACRDCKSDQP